MRILLLNPPNCGRSIPEERYGIVSLKQIFRGEPLALEELAGNLIEHELCLIDLKADPQGLEQELDAFAPDMVGITGLSCEANTMLALAREIKSRCSALVSVGGLHASNDPEFFNQPEVDFIVVGPGKKSFAELIALIEQQGNAKIAHLPQGIYRTRPGKKLALRPRRMNALDLVEERPPAYELVRRYRSQYRVEKLGLNMGFVASAYGCPHRCGFCSIHGQTGGSYVTKSVNAVLRDISLLGDIPVIRLVDANTFGDPVRATELGQALVKAQLNKHFLADLRADTALRHPELMALWRDAGLRAVIIGFEAIDDQALSAMNKKSSVDANTQAIHLLHELGITVVGDFILSPEASQEDFDRLARYLERTAIDLPMITVLTPLPGTPLYQQLYSRISLHDLDYYTLTNAVMPTRLPEERFYAAYAGLLANSHHQARL